MNRQAPHHARSYLLGPEGSCGQGEDLARAPAGAGQPTLLNYCKLGNYLFFFFAWDSAEAAADLEAALVLPSLRTADATEAALGEVTFPGEAWERALPAAVLEDLPVEELERTPEEVVTTRGLVTFLTMTV